MALGEILGGAASLASSLFGGGDSPEEDAVKELKRGTGALRRITDDLRAGQYSGFPTGDFFGRRAEFAPFNQVSATDEQLAAILGNQNALSSGLIDNVSQTNAANRLSNELRFDELVPGGLNALMGLGENAQQLSQGFLPFDDALSVVRDRAGFAQQLGLNGTQLGGALPRDLGMSRLQAMQAGAGMLGQGAHIANAIDPVDSQFTAQQNFLGPEFSSQFAANQAILDQQSRQGQNLFDAAPDPAAQGILNLDTITNLARAGQAAAAANLNTGPNYGLIGEGITSLVGGFQQLGSGNPYGDGLDNGQIQNAARTATSFAGDIGRSVGNLFGSAGRGIGNFVGGLF